MRPRRGREKRMASSSGVQRTAVIYDSDDERILTDVEKAAAQAIIFKNAMKEIIRHKVDSPPSPIESSPRGGQGWGAARLKFWTLKKFLPS